MTQVFSAMVGGLVGFGMSLGLGHSELLATAKVRAEDLADPDRLVPYEALVEIWALLVERFPGQPLGLRYAAQQRLELYGLIGQLCLAAPTAAESIAHVRRYLSIVDPHMQLSVGPCDAGYRMSIDHEPRVYALFEPLELIVSAAIRLSLQAVGEPLEGPSTVLREVAFRHRRRHPAALYTDLFRCPVRFEAGYDGATFDPVVLARPLPRANPTVARYLRQLAERHLEERVPPRSALLQRLHEALGAALLAGEARAPEVARRLGMSARTLQRRLAQEATTFRGELDAHRERQAYRLLRDPERNAGEVAYLLGYADPAHFFRSFRRWTGQTPQQWRRAQA